MWQDAVFSAGTVIFILALLPTLLGPNKPSPITSVLTGAILICFAITYVTLGLWLSGSVAFINAIVWLVIFFQVSSLQTFAKAGIMHFDATIKGSKRRFLPDFFRQR
jgi:hypothetical protein